MELETIKVVNFMSDEPSFLIINLRDFDPAIHTPWNEDRTIGTIEPAGAAEPTEPADSEDTGDSGDEAAGDEDTGGEDTGGEDTGDEDTGGDDTPPPTPKTAQEKKEALAAEALENWGEELDINKGLKKVQEDFDALKAAAESAEE